MTLEPQERWKLVCAVGLLAFAGVASFRFYSGQADHEGRAYFYDLSAGKLFVAPHSSVPPIRGPFGSEEDGVRAIVVSLSGDCSDEKSRTIAYLETYAPELKHQIEKRKRGGSADAAEASPTLSRGQAQGYILIRRPEETDWHAMNSPAAQQILQRLNSPGPLGKIPVVCVP